MPPLKPIRHNNIEEAVKPLISWVVLVVLSSSLHARPGSVILRPSDSQVFQILIRDEGPGQLSTVQVEVDLPDAATKPESVGLITQFGTNESFKFAAGIEPLPLTATPDSEGAIRVSYVFTLPKGWIYNSTLIINWEHFNFYVFLRDWRRISGFRPRPIPPATTANEITLAPEDPSPVSISQSIAGGSYFFSITVDNRAVPFKDDFPQAQMEILDKSGTRLIFRCDLAARLTFRSGVMSFMRPQASYGVRIPLELVERAVVLFTPAQAFGSPSSPTYRLQLKDWIAKGVVLPDRPTKGTKFDSLSGARNPGK